MRKTEKFQRLVVSRSTTVEDCYVLCILNHHENPLKFQRGLLYSIYDNVLYYDFMMPFTFWANGLSLLNKKSSVIQELLSVVRMACKLLYTRRLLSLLKEMTQVLFNKEPLGKREKSLGQFKQTAHITIDRRRSNRYFPLVVGASITESWHKWSIGWWLVKSLLS